jgi:hypothetical protein
VARDKRNGGHRDRRGETLFIDARKLGSMTDRTHRELTDADIARVAGAYHAWRGDPDAAEYADVPGFCKAATLDETSGHGHILTPGRYVGAEAAEEDAEPFDVKMRRLVATLADQQAESARLDALINANLRELGYGEGVAYDHHRGAGNASARHRHHQADPATWTRASRVFRRHLQLPRRRGGLRPRCSGAPGLADGGGSRSRP